MGIGIFSKHATKATNDSFQNMLKKQQTVLCESEVRNLYARSILRLCFEPNLNSNIQG